MRLGSYESAILPGTLAHKANYPGCVPLRDNPLTPKGGPRSERLGPFTDLIGRSPEPGRNAFCERSSRARPDPPGTAFSPTPPAVRKIPPAEPARAAPVISAHMENGIIIGAAVLCIITLALLLTVKR